MSLVAYPESFPIEAFILLKDKVKGSNISAAALTNAAWNVVGYGLSLGLPIKDQVQPIGAGPDDPEEDEKVLTQLIEGHEAGGANFPIALVALAVRIALKFLL